MKPSRLLAITQGSLTTIIWASSFVFIKMGLAYLNPFTLAGMRYFAAFLLLLPLIARPGRPTDKLTGTQWVQLLLMGLCAYTIANGALFWGLKRLPAVTGSFLFSLLPLPVFFLGVFWLREKPRRLQIIGLLTTLVGSALFFFPGLIPTDPVAVGIVSLGVLAFGFYGSLSRRFVRDQSVDIVRLTAIPLGFGGGLLLVFGFIVEGRADLSLAGLAIVLWLAIVNTIIAYVLYYRSLRILTALELHILLNLAPLGTALMAGLILGERLRPIQLIGMLTVILGVTLVQWKRREKSTIG